MNPFYGNFRECVVNGDKRSYPAPVNSTKTLSYKLEYVILSILLYYQGGFSGSLTDWYIALRPGLPQLADPDQLREVFHRLSEDGIIKLSKSGTRFYIHREQEDGQPPHGAQFSASLNPNGPGQWKISHPEQRLVSSMKNRSLQSPKVAEMSAS
jgi:hypothetical protein